MTSRSEIQCQVSRGHRDSSYLWLVLLCGVRSWFPVAAYGKYASPLTLVWLCSLKKFHFWIGFSCMGTNWKSHAKFFHSMPPAKPDIWIRNRSKRSFKSIIETKHSLIEWGFFFESLFHISGCCGLIILGSCHRCTWQRPFFIHINHRHRFFGNAWNCQSLELSLAKLGGLAMIIYL